MGLWGSIRSAASSIVSKVKGLFGGSQSSPSPQAQQAKADQVANANKVATTGMRPADQQGPCLQCQAASDAAVASSKPVTTDVDKAVEKLRKQAETTPEFGQGDCAKFVRQALNAGGWDVVGVTSAKDFGPQLEAAGLKKADITKDTYWNDSKQWQKGDVAVIQAYGKTGSGTSKHGHMAMYDGEQWISDFEQRDMYGAPAARPKGDYKGADYEIYRP